MDQCQCSIGWWVTGDQVKVNRDIQYDTIIGIDHSDQQLQCVY